MSRLVIITCAAALLAGCGSGGSTTSTGGSGGNTGGNSGGGPVSAPVVVTASAGATGAAGVDIAVVGPASSTPPNAQIIGAASTSASSIGLTNTEAKISKSGGTQVVALCGPGLSSSMSVGVGDAPGVANSDFTISSITGVTCNGGTGTTSQPGLQFNITVASGAPLGNRTVFLQSTNNDVTTFTGGLEVVP